MRVHVSACCLPGTVPVVLAATRPSRGPLVPAAGVHARVYVCVCVCVWLCSAFTPVLHPCSHALSL